MISPFYDPMIAKLIVKGVDRTSAIFGLTKMCERVVCWPVKYNAQFLANLLKSQHSTTEASTRG